MHKFRSRLTALRFAGLALLLVVTMLTAVVVATGGNQESSVSWKVEGPQGSTGPSEPAGQWILIESVSHDVQHSVAIGGSGGAASPVRKSVLVVEGTRIPAVEIHPTRTDVKGNESLYQVGGSSCEGSEQLSLDLEKIKVTHYEYDDQGKRKGKVEYTWKVE